MAKTAVQTFGKYQILERIATGGMAEIYKARLEGIGGFQRTFAIKRILPHLSQNAEYVAMLVDEAKVAGLLSHANIVQILDLGQVDGVWFIAMEFVQGPDLGAVLRRCRAKGIELPVPHTVFIAIELLKGLEYAHQRQVMRGGRQVPLNIIHRDVSPPNVLLSLQGEVKLTDFGIARASHKALETATGVIKGRFDYMSPEQAAGAKDLDQRSDLFSVGVVLYEMLTGRHPFRAESELATIERVRTGRYEPASVVNPGVPFTLETIVDRALRVDRNERYPNATAFKEALDKFFHDAGFIFTHHGLSGYVRGLFPELAEGESRPTPDAPSAPPAFEHTPRVELDAFDESGEGPTRVIDKSKLSLQPPTEAGVGVFGLRNDDTATLVRKHAGRTGWEEEQETMVRKAPPGLRDDEDDPPTLTTHAGRDDEPESPTQADEGNTLIRRHETVEASDHSNSIPPTPIDQWSRPASTGFTGPVPTSPPPQRRAGPGPVVAALAAAATFMVGLFVGTVIGVVVSQALGLGRPTAAMPILQVQMPPGVTVLVDETPVAGAINLAPRVSHELKITYPGHEPVQNSITLQSGEIRVLIVSPIEPGVTP